MAKHIDIEPLCSGNKEQDKHILLLFLVISISIFYYKYDKKANHIMQFKKNKKQRIYLRKNIYKYYPYIFS